MHHFFHRHFLNILSLDVIVDVMKDVKLHFENSRFQKAGFSWHVPGSPYYNNLRVLSL